MNPLWISFPPHLSAPTVRSLSLIFLIEELSSQFLELANGIDADSFLALKELIPPLRLVPNKLCFYCRILLKTSQADGQSALKILEEIRAAILQGREKMLEKPLLKEILWEKMVKEYEDLLRALFLSFIPFLQEARADENVLLTLFEKQETLDLFLGKGTIETLLQSFFPQGEMDARTVIQEGFRKRGFGKFLKSKQHLLEPECTPLISFTR